MMAVRLVTADYAPAPGARLGEWQKAVRDHPARPPALQCLVLDRLALRLDWSAGAGYASVADLAADAGCTQRTVSRATRWALGHGLLERTRRGHALRSGKGIASRWRLTLPAESGTGLPVPLPEPGSGHRSPLPESGTGHRRPLPGGLEPDSGRLEPDSEALEPDSEALEPDSRAAPSAFNTSSYQSSIAPQPEHGTRNALARPGATTPGNRWTRPTVSSAAVGTGHDPGRLSAECRTGDCQRCPPQQRCDCDCHDGPL